MLIKKKCLSPGIKLVRVVCSGDPCIICNLRSEDGCPNKECCRVTKIALGDNYDLPGCIYDFIC